MQKNSLFYNLFLHKCIKSVYITHKGMKGKILSRKRSGHKKRLQFSKKYAIIPTKLEKEGI
jgi:hypothetical protein